MQGSAQNCTNNRPVFWTIAAVSVGASGIFASARKHPRSLRAGDGGKPARRGRQGASLKLRKNQSSNAVDSRTDTGKPDR